MKIRIYNNFSDTFNYKDVSEGVSLANSLPGIDFNKYAVIANGKIANGDFIPHKNDVVLIRRYPQGVEQGGAAWWTFNILTVGLYGSIDSGYQAQVAKEKLAKIQKELENSSTTVDSATNAPYINGASNSIATGKTQPYVIGEHLFVPYVLNSGGLASGSASGFHTISGETGEKSFYNVVLEGGFCDQVIRKIKCENVTLKTFDSSETTPQDGTFNFDSDGSFYDEENVIEIRQDGTALTTDEFKYKIIEKSSGASVPKADADDYEPVILTLEKNTMAADVVISFAGLVAYDSDDGTKISRTVNVTPYYSLDGGTTWTAFTFTQNGTKSNDFTYKTTEEIRFNAHIDFDYDDVKDLDDVIQIKLESTTNTYDGSAYDTANVLFTHSYIYNPTSSATAGDFVKDKVIEDTEAALSTVIGLKIKATSNNENLFDKISVYTAGIARTWDGSEWSTIKTPTSNVAAWVLEILTSDTHKPSKCDDDEIDLDAFGAWYEYCEDEGLNVDRVLTEGTTKQELLESVAAIGYGSLYNNIYGLISVAIDKPQDNAIGIINPENVVSLSWEKELLRQPDGMKVSYISRAADYVTDAEIVMKDGKTRDAESTLTEETVTGIVNHEQIVKYIRRKMAIEELRVLKLTAEVGPEGIFYTPLAKILVQSPGLKNGLGHATVKSLILNEAKTEILGLNLYDAIEYDSAESDGFGIVCNVESGNNFKTFAAAYTATENGRVTKIYFTDPVTIEESGIYPQNGDPLSYGYLSGGEFTKIYTPFLISGIEPNGNTLNLNLVEYNEAIYDSGTIPDYVPNITQPRTKTTVSTAKRELTLDDVTNLMSEGGGSTAPDTLGDVIATAEENKIILSYKNAGSGTSNSLKNILYEISKDGGSTWAVVSDDTLESEYTFDRSTDGYPEAETLANWKVRAKAQNLAGLWSENYKTGSINTDSYGTWSLQAPEITSRVSGRGISLIISQPARSDGREVYGTIKNRVQIKRVTETADTQYYKPATSADPYASEDNYKVSGDTGYVEVSNIYQQTLPLKGQNETEPLPVDTTYKFSVVAANEANTSDATETDNIIAMATSAADIVAAAITTNKLAIAAVTATNISDSAVTTAKIDNSAITTVKIADDAITAAKIAAKTITASEIAAGAITTEKLDSGSVTTAKLGALAVTADKIAAGTITADKIAAVNLAANGATFGNISGDAVSINANNYWQLSTDSTKTYETGEFRIGNDKSLEEDDDDSAEYIHYKPSTGLLMKIKKFFIKSIGSVFAGPVYIKAKNSSEDGDSFVVINPTIDAESVCNTGAGTMIVKGILGVTGYFSGPGWPDFYKVAKPYEVNLYSESSSNIYELKINLIAHGMDIGKISIVAKDRTTGSSAEHLSFEFCSSGTWKIFTNLNYTNYTAGNILSIYSDAFYAYIYVRGRAIYNLLVENATLTYSTDPVTTYTGTKRWTCPGSYITHHYSILDTVGSASLPIYYNNGRAVACTASSLFSSLSSTKDSNLSATIAGQTRTATTIYASYLAGIGAHTSGSSTAGTAYTNAFIYATAWKFSTTGGYIKFSNGLLMQWKKITYTSARSYTSTVTFDLDFTSSSSWLVFNSPITANTSSVNSAGISATPTGTKTAAYIVYGVASADRFTGCQLFAIGY